MVKGFFKNAMNNLIEARERQARTFVSSHLLTYSDERLKQMGTSRAELLREGSGVTFL